MAGDQNDVNISGKLATANGLAQLDAVHARHVPIGNHQPACPGPQLFQRVDAIAGRVHFEPRFDERVLQHFAGNFIVFDNENLHDVVLRRLTCCEDGVSFNWRAMKFKQRVGFVPEVGDNCDAARKLIGATGRFQICGQMAQSLGRQIRGQSFDGMRLRRRLSQIAFSMDSSKRVRSSWQPFGKLSRAFDSQSLDFPCSAARALRD